MSRVHSKATSGVQPKLVAVPGPFSLLVSAVERNQGIYQRLALSLETAWNAASSLSEVLATIPDPRKPSGLRHPLPAIFNLIVVATLSGMRSLEAVAQFARPRQTADSRARFPVRQNTL